MGLEPFDEVASLLLEVKEFRIARMTLVHHHRLSPSHTQYFAGLLIGDGRRRSFDQLNVLGHLGHVS